MRLVDCASDYVIKQQPDSPPAVGSDQSASFDCENDDANDDVDVIDDDEGVTPTKRSRKRRRVTNTNSSSALKRRTSRIRKSSSSSSSSVDRGDSDPDVTFGRHITNELKLIRDLRARQFAKLQIHSILFNAQFGLMDVPHDVPANVFNGSSIHTHKPTNDRTS